jgi:hypothetical protein
MFRHEDIRNVVILALTLTLTALYSIKSYAQNQGIESYDLSTEIGFLTQVESINTDLMSLNLKKSEVELFQLDYAIFKQGIYDLVQRTGTSRFELLIPNGTGERERFQFEETSVMESLLQQKFASIRTYTGKSLESGCTAKMRTSDSGLKLMIFNSEFVTFIEQL